jgi:hypothetical protein
MKRQLIAVTAVALAAAPVAGQDLEEREIVVTASRIEQDDYSSEMPAVGLRRTADFLVMEVVIRGDTRDETPRRREIHQMLEQAVRLAPQHGVELAFGDYILTPLTMETIDELTVERDNRPDSERIDFLVKAPLGQGETGSAAEARISRYVEAVPEVGRAQMDKVGDPTLSIVGPDRYRQEVAQLVTRDAAAMAATMGDSYAVEIEGLNMPVQWARSGASEVMLYVPYRLVIVPRP